MEINSAFNAGLQGIQNSQQRLEQNAENIASVAVTENRRTDNNEAPQPQSSVNVAEELVDLRQNELAYKASIEVVRNADQLLSKFVDELV
ncbi:hypothetical protein KFE80_12455 [bacterium SCSIO 12696]|nr:hypothetical protein KFE80_12455 [bacterium SCSIO 12696]